MKFASLFVFLILFTIILKAQQIADTSEYEVQVIGIKPGKRTPVTQTIVTLDSLPFLNQTRDPFFVLDKTVPGIYSQSDNGTGNGYSYIHLRGFDQTRINFNLNGVPLNEMEDQGIYFSNIPGIYNYLSTFNVERGVSTSKYGSSGLGGSVNMETRDIYKKRVDINALLYSSLHKDRFVSTFYNSGIHNKFGFQTGISLIQNQGFKNNSGNEGASVFYGLNYANANNLVKLYGISGLTRNQLAYNGVPMDSLEKNYKANTNLVSDKDTFNQHLIVLNWLLSKHLNTSIYYNNINGRYNAFNVLYGVYSYQEGILSNLIFNSNRSEYNLGLNFNIYQRYHFGSDYNKYYYLPGTLFTEYNNTGSKYDLSAYLKSVVTVSGKLYFNYDVQFRRVRFGAKSRDYSTDDYTWYFINPKIGLKYVSLTTEYYSTLAITSREPTRTDMIQNSIQNDAAKLGGNTERIELLSGNIKPEQVLDYELGTRYFKNRLEIKMNMFAMVTYNEYVQTGLMDLNSGFMVKRVTDKSVRYGLESEGNYRFRHFKAIYTLQWMKSRYYVADSVFRLNFAPNITTNFGLLYNIKKVNLGLYWQHIGGINVVNDEQSYDLFNAFLDYKFHNFVIAARVNNLFNTKYYVPASINNYYAGVLLNYNFSLAYKL